VDSRPARSAGRAKKVASKPLNFFFVEKVGNKTWNTRGGTLNVEHNRWNKRWKTKDGRFSLSNLQVMISFQARPLLVNEIKISEVVMQIATLNFGVSPKAA